MTVKEISSNDGWSNMTNRAVYGINSGQGSFHTVKSKDLESLKIAVDKWSDFLRHVFVSSAQGYISRDVLTQIALEDTELFLDVKIQLSQFTVNADKNSVITPLERICNSIRKNSYNFIAVTLPSLSDNSKQLVEARHNTSLIKTQCNKTLFVDSSPNFGDSDFEYQEGLSACRKQVIFQVQKQHREIILQLHQLNKKINSTFVSDEFEL